MATETNVNIKIQIPAGHTAKIENNTVIFEPKTAKFKKGDFVASIGGYVYIFNGHEGERYDWFAKARTEKQILLDKLHEAGKDWDAEKCEIVAIKYIPEIGDCVKVQLWDGEFCVFECTEKDQESVNSHTYIYQPKQKVFIDDDSEFGWRLNRDGNVFTKITPEDLQSEFNVLGYMYDFAAHTAKLIEWKPKAGDTIWSINAKWLINEWTFSGRGSFVPDLMDFRTPELAEAALESLKQSKHY